MNYQYSTDEIFWAVHQKGENDFQFSPYWVYTRFRNTTITDSNITFSNGKAGTGGSGTYSDVPWQMVPKSIYGVKGCEDVMAFLSVVK